MFKVKDIVLIARPLARPFEGLSWVDEMDSTVGKKGVIIEIEVVKKVPCYRVYIGDDYLFVWENDMLILDEGKANAADLLWWYSSASLEYLGNTDSLAGNEERTFNLLAIEARKYSLNTNKRKI